MAKVLTHEALQSLATLDAGDSVECYAVSRLSKIEAFEDLTPTEPSKSPPRFIQSEDSEEDEKIVYVRKSAIAFRFKSRLQNSDSLYSSFKPPFELTLEYGPQRGGIDLDSETLPMVLTHANGQEDYNAFHKYVTWENEGKIYYESSIDTERWDTADYIAPITGSVLSKVLEHALQYPLLHPRYQPFEVYDVTRESVVIPSSSSEDFVWDMYDKMARMFVDIRPILTPSRSKIRFHVDGLHSIKRLKMARGVDLDENHDDSTNGGDVAREVVEFYEKMYTCSSKILNNDYELFLPKEDEAEEENSLEDESNVSLVTEEEYDATTESNVEESNDKNDMVQNITVEDETIDNNVTDPAQNGSTDSLKMDDLDEGPVIESLDLNQTDDVSIEDENVNGSGRNLYLDTKDVIVKPSTPSTSPLNLDITGSPTFLSTASQESSTAAQATAIAMSQNAKQNLISGIGPLMTSAILPCITSSTIDKKETLGYLFVDSSTYYRLNLTFPYLEVRTLHPNMPAPHPLQQGKGSVVDWMFVLMIVGGFLYGIYKILHHVRLIDDFKNLGVCFKRCLNLKESPYAYANENEGEGFVMDPTSSRNSRSNEKTMFAGGGNPHNFGQDAIPPSMGGKMTGGPSAKRTYEDMKVINGVTVLGVSGNGSRNSKKKHDDEEEEEDMELGALENSMDVRIQRDPDLVDLPNLVSRSKVALPLSSMKKS